MEKVVGVKFKPSGKVYDFECGHYVLNVNDKVIVSVEQGLGFGVVAKGYGPFWGLRARLLLLCHIPV